MMEWIWYAGVDRFLAFAFIFSTSPYDLALNQTQIRQFCHNQFNDKESIFEQKIPISTCKTQKKLKTLWFPLISNMKVLHFCNTQKNSKFGV